VADNVPAFAEKAAFCAAVCL